MQNSMNSNNGGTRLSWAHKSIGLLAVVMMILGSTPGVAQPPAMHMISPGAKYEVTNYGGHTEMAFGPGNMPTSPGNMPTISRSPTRSSSSRSPTRSSSSRSPTRSSSSSTQAELPQGWSLEGYSPENKKMTTRIRDAQASGAKTVSEINRVVQSRCLDEGDRNCNRDTISRAVLTNTVVNAIMSVRGVKDQLYSGTPPKSPRRSLGSRSSSSISMQEVFPRLEDIYEDEQGSVFVSATKENYKQFRNLDSLLYSKTPKSKLDKRAWTWAADRMSDMSGASYIPLLTKEVSLSNGEKIKTKLLAVKHNSASGTVTIRLANGDDEFDILFIRSKGFGGQHLIHTAVKDNKVTSLTASADGNLFFQDGQKIVFLDNGSESESESESEGDSDMWKDIGMEIDAEDPIDADPYTYTLTVKDFYGPIPYDYRVICETHTDTKGHDVITVQYGNSTYLKDASTGARFQKVACGSKDSPRTTYKEFTGSYSTRSIQGRPRGRDICCLEYYNT